MAKKFLDLTGLNVFKAKIKEMLDSRIKDDVKVETYNDYWVVISQDNSASNTNSAE
jgi:hypothetical protein